MIVRRSVCPAPRLTSGRLPYPGVTAVYDMDAKLTIAEAEMYFRQCGQNISRAAVNRWRSLGRIDSAGTNSKGQHLYRLGDLLRAEAATRRSPNSRRSALAAA